MYIYICIYLYTHIYICACEPYLLQKLQIWQNSKFQKAHPQKRDSKNKPWLPNKHPFAIRLSPPKKGEINQTMTFSRFTFSKKIGNTLHHSCTTMKMVFIIYSGFFPYILDGFSTGFETPSRQALKDVSRPQVTHLGPLGGTTKDRGFRRSKARRKFCSKSTIMDWAMGRWMDGWMDAGGFW